MLDIRAGHFADRIYGLAHCLIDRNGRVIGVNLPLAKEPPLPPHTLSSNARIRCISSVERTPAFRRSRRNALKSGPERDPAVQLIARLPAAPSRQRTHSCGRLCKLIARLCGENLSNTPEMSVFGASEAARSGVFRGRRIGYPNLRALARAIRCGGAKLRPLRLSIGAWDLLDNNFVTHRLELTAMSDRVEVIGNKLGIMRPLNGTDIELSKIDTVEMNIVNNIPCIGCHALFPDVDGPVHRYIESSS
jgi:hypothetical protein